MEASVGRYRVIGRVGQGSSGTVYLAHDPELDRPVAIKELAPSLAGDPGFVERFRGEAQVMARLDHPNCVRVYELVEEPGHEYLVFEFVNGASLREVAHQGRLTPEQALGVLHGALAGLGHAHGLGLVHRDVKPDNIMCDAAGDSKIGDFGLAAPAGGGGDGAMGTPAYMSPEQVGGGPVDARSDVYSAGATLFELLEGRPPFAGTDAIAVMRQQVDAAPPPMSPEVPPPVAELVARALAKNPAERPAGAVGFAEELEGAATTAYGPDWRRRSGIAEAVGAAAAAGAAAASTIASAVASGALGGATTGVATVAAAAVGGAAAPAPGQPPPPAAVGTPPPGAGGRTAGRSPLRSRRVQVVAAVLVLLVLAGAGAGLLALRRPPAAPAAVVDACVVGSWTSTREYFLFHDSDINLDSRLTGGAGEHLTIAADGSSVSDMNATSAFTGDNGGHHYSVLERGRSAGKVATDGDTLTVTPGQKLEGLTFVADRDGAPWGGGTPEVAKLATTGSTIKRSCSEKALTLSDGPYQTTYERAAAAGAPATPSPCGAPSANTTMSLCPRRVAPGQVIEVHSLVSCYPPGQSPPSSLTEPSISLFVAPRVAAGGLASTLARFTFPLDKSGNWSGRMMIDPFAKIAPGPYTVGGGCFDAGVNVQNGFGVPFGPVDLQLTAG